MPSEKKIDQVKNLTERLKEAKSVVLVDYQGLTHPQLSELRKRLESGGGSLMVTKNTLLKLALKSSTYNLQPTTYNLTGPTATLFIKNDPIPPLKALANFLNEFSLPKIKIGFLEGATISKEKILRLATLPSKEILISQVITGFKTPSQRLTLSLLWNLQKLTMILKTLKL